MFQKVREKLGLCFSAWKLERAMKDVRRTFRRAGKVFVREGGGWPARLWFFWKLNWQWLLVVPIAPLALAAAIQPPVLAVILVWLLVRSRR